MSFVNSNVRQGSYGPNFIASMESADLIRAGIYQKVFKQYGKMYGMHDVLMMAGNEISVPAQNQKVVEEYAPKWPIKLGAAIAAGAVGDAITVVVDATSLISNVHQARVGFSVKIPADYMPAGVKKDGIYRITALSQTNVANDTLTCEPFLADATSLAAAQIATEVPAGTYIDVSGYSSFARGEGQPVGTYDYPVTRTYTSGIIKETKGFDGGVLSQESAVAEYNGTRWLLSKESFDAEFRLKDQLDDALTFSEENDNTALVTSSTMSTQSQDVRSTRGLISWLDDAGQSVYFVDTPDLTVLDDVKDALLTQGVYTQSVTLFVSPWFFSKIQPEIKDYVREYSGGSDFLDGVKEKMGVTVYVVNWAGIDFYIHPVATWGNPSDAGLIVSDSAVYAAGKMAIAVPNTKVTVGKWGEEANITIPNLWLGYVNANGENRKFMMGRYLGVNGVFDTNLVATDLDGYKLYWAREFMLGGAEWNKMVIIRQQKV